MITTITNPIGPTFVNIPNQLLVDSNFDVFQNSCVIKYSTARRNQFSISYITPDHKDGEV